MLGVLKKYKTHTVEQTSSISNINYHGWTVICSNNSIKKGEDRKEGGFNTIMDYIYYLDRYRRKCQTNLSTKAYWSNIDCL